MSEGSPPSALAAIGSYFQRAEKFLPTFTFFLVLFLYFFHHHTSEIAELQNDIAGLKADLERLKAASFVSDSNFSFVDDLTIASNCSDGNTSGERRVCSEGWSGVSCDEAICTLSCANGECTEPNRCSCRSGWKGDLCDQKEIILPILFHKAVSRASHKGILEIMEQLTRDSFPGVTFEEINPRNPFEGSRDVVVFVVNTAGSARVEVDFPPHVIDKVKQDVKATNLVFLALQYKKGVKTSPIAKSGIQIDPDTFQKAQMELRLNLQDELQDVEMSQASVTKALNTISSYFEEKLK